MKLSICIANRNRSRVKITWDGYEDIGSRGIVRKKDARFYPEQAGEYTLELFPKCLASICNALRFISQVEIIVADYHSTDWPLSEWLQQRARGIPVKIVSLEGRFSRGAGLNAAAQQAQGEHLLFLDTDMLAPEMLIRRGLAFSRSGYAYFPICYSYQNPMHSTGWWRVTGRGNVLLSKRQFLEVEGWQENESWGGEDGNFYTKTRGRRIREIMPGFYHQWHPSGGGFRTQAYEEYIEGV